MRVVWKYKIERSRLDQMMGLRLFVGANPTVLHVAAQRDKDTLPTLWVECDESGEQAILDVSVVATGDRVPKGETHIGSCVCDGGNLIWHIYAAEVYLDSSSN